MAADASEFTALFEAHFAYVWRSLLRLGAPRRDAEDLAQDVFVIVHRRLADYDRERPIKPWLFGIAYNVVRDYRRRAGHQREHLTETPMDVGREDPGLRALDSVQLVHQALLRLPHERRAVFVLYELDHVAMKEIGEVLAIPVDTAYSRLRKAREEFREAVAKLRVGGVQ